jgi:hypothetical protein
MTYRPTEAFFGPPWVVRVPSLVYLLIAVTALIVLIVAEQGPSDTWLYVKLVEEDVRHIISARTLVAVLLVSATAATLRAGMRGVRVRGDAVEYRDVVAFGWPKVKRYKWAQIDRIILDSSHHVSLDLWDGTRAFLPTVSDRVGLSAALEKVAAARAIPVRGGRGIDEIPESGEYDTDETP